VLTTRPSGMSTSAETAEPEARSGKRKAEDPPSEEEAEGDEDVLKEYLCPITQELPTVFCTAEDGHCYDRWAFEKWLEQQKTTQVKSPMTNETIGRRLVPAVQARNAVERLIDKGIIKGEGATKWMKTQAELAAMTETMRKTFGNAHKGQAKAQRVYAFACRDGTDGVGKSLPKAWEWYHKAAAQEDATAVASIGVFYMNGQGTPKDPSSALVWMTRAAMIGSEHACICLGNYYDEPKGLFPKPDQLQAGYWYTRSLRQPHKDSTEPEHKRRDEWLKEHGQWEARAS